MDYNLRQAIKREELDSPEVIAYVSDVYKFLTIITLFYILGVYLPTYYQTLNVISYHWFLITSLVSLILTIDGGGYSILFGSIFAVSFGTLWSNYFLLEPEVMFVIGCGIFIIFFSATICSRIFPSRRLVVFSGSIITLIQLGLLLWLTGMHSRIYVMIWLITMTFHVYYNMTAVFNQAKQYDEMETSIRRNTYVTIDAFCVLFLGLFMR